MADELRVIMPADVDSCEARSYANIGYVAYYCDAFDAAANLSDSPEAEGAGWERSNRGDRCWGQRRAG